MKPTRNHNVPPSIFLPRRRGHVIGMSSLWWAPMVGAIIYRAICNELDLDCGWWITRAVIISICPPDTPPLKPPIHQPWFETNTKMEEGRGETCEFQILSFSKMMLMNHPNHAIDYIEFSAPDLVQIKSFYQGVFGWPFTDWGPDYVSFEAGPICGGFEKRDKNNPGGPLVVLYADNLENTQDAVLRHGGKITKPIYRFPGGRRFHFSDVGGNELAVWTE